ncbi:MAG TPA: YfiR family protein [bacterium]|nr:YfiR family protein [bacterium]
MKRQILTFVSAFFLAFPWVETRLQGQEVSEYQVKAAYLFNFTKFVDWPQTTLTPEKKTFIIGVLGEDPFGGTLEQAVAGKVAKGLPIEIRRIDDFDPDDSAKLTDCQILFIAYSQKSRLSQILKALRKAPVLTVSEIENFSLAGGVILFDQVGKRIKLVVNPGAARRASLGISARLLQVAKLYRSE